MHDRTLAMKVQSQQQLIIGTESASSMPSVSSEVQAANINVAPALLCCMILINTKCPQTESSKHYNKAKCSQTSPIPVLRR